MSCGVYLLHSNKRGLAARILKPIVILSLGLLLGEENLHANPLVLPQDIVPEQKIGFGAYKYVHSVVGDSGIVILRSNKTNKKDGRYILQYELDLLKTLESFGIRVPRFHSKLLNIEDRPAIVMERYLAGSKTDLAFYEILNEQSHRDLEEVQNSINRANIRISDLQFLIAKGGRIVVSDPLSIKKTTERTKSNNVEKRLAKNHMQAKRRAKSLQDAALKEKYEPRVQQSRMEGARPIEKKRGLLRKILRRK